MHVERVVCAKLSHKHKRGFVELMNVLLRAQSGFRRVSGHGQLSELAAALRAVALLRSISLPFGSRCGTL